MALFAHWTVAAVLSARAFSFEEAAEATAAIAPLIQLSGATERPAEGSAE
ncbi:exported protein of unknown function [Pseudorhizobium banfieldiae]|uniref:Uncharacterized protein n=1 Tax=Pseudorhizobium banfieldiae TaxID=1125847 RepID=L0NM24_9HYPH|nr:exported protein of unknown function [Pseudorhizobium banfieldiae]